MLNTLPNSNPQVIVLQIKSYLTILTFGVAVGAPYPSNNPFS